MTNYGKSLKPKLSHLFCQKHKTRRDGNRIKICPHSSGFHLNAFSVKGWSISRLLKLFWDANEILIKTDWHWFVVIIIGCNYIPSLGAYT